MNILNWKLACFERARELGKFRNMSKMFPRDLFAGLGCDVVKSAKHDCWRPSLLGDSGNYEDVDMAFLLGQIKPSIFKEDEHFSGGRRRFWFTVGGEWVPICHLLVRSCNNGRRRGDIRRWLRRYWPLSVIQAPLRSWEPLFCRCAVKSRMTN